jgi:hypothetical protein
MLRARREPAAFADNAPERKALLRKQPLAGGARPPGLRPGLEASVVQIMLGVSGREALSRPKPSVIVSNPQSQEKAAMNDQTASIVEALPFSWIKKELVFDGPVKRRQRGRKAKQVQEWLCLNGIHIAIDSDFGQVTETAVAKFQGQRRLAKTGVVDEATFDKLVEPLLKALAPIPAGNKTLNQLVAAYARQHLALHPREIGGENCGPWVRLYMEGHDGKEWLWCAGFVCFILRQAARQLDVPMPFKRTFSCDALAEQAKQKDLFVSERSLTNSGDHGRLTGGTIFLSRRTANDWTHTGLVLDADSGVFSTIEGNTNDEGSREGYEVCRRMRGYAKKDFVLLA